MKWAIFGAGNISNTFCENLIQLEKAEIFSISSKNKGRLDSFGNKFNIKTSKRFDNYSDILSLDFDIAYIGLINSLHKKVVKDLILNNKNILVEKPCFLNLVDFDENISLLKNKNILFVESMMNLHHPQTSKIFEFIKEGKIGSLVKFTHNFGFDIRKKFLKFFKKKINFLNRLTDPSLGGGAINDLGCYGVSFSNKLASLNGSAEIKDIKTKKRICETGVDENSKIEILYQNNFKSILEVAINKKLGCNAEIIGTKGKIIIPNLIKPGLNYKIYLKKEKTYEYNFFGKELYTYIARDVQRYVENNLKEPDGYGLKLNEIRKNIKILENWKS